METISYPIDDINNWHADADYAQRGGKLIHRSPDFFLRNTKPLAIDDDSRENIEHLKDHILDGGTLDPLTIYSMDKSNVRNSDGRHRAMACKELGITKVPIIVFPEEPFTQLP